MSESNQPLPSEDPPLTVADDEVERLLSQAQSLAADIATLAKVEEPAVASPDIPIDLEQGKLDPAAATATLEQSVAELAGLVGDPDAAASARPDPSSSPEPAIPSVPSAPPQDAGHGLADDPDHEAATSRHGLAETGGIAFDDALVGDVDVNLDESATPVPVEEIATKSSFRAAAVASSLRERLTTWRRKLSTAGVRLAHRMPGGLVGVFVLFDRPFAGLSPATKQAIGYVAIVTILMGIASLVLPGLLESNPYVQIPL